MPNRIIKESIRTSDTINELTFAEETFFYRLVTCCDDYGRMDGRVQVLRPACFPLRLDQISDADVGEFLWRLREVGLVELYTVGGRAYLQMVTWDRHQQMRAKRPKFPAPSDGEPIETLDMWRDINGYQVTSSDSICSRNPIQSNPIQSTSQNSPRPKPVAGQIPASPEKPTMLFTPDTPQYELAALLRAKILNRNPKAKVPKLNSGSFQAWCYHIDLLLRVDDRDAEEVTHVIEWAQADSFWHQNILSTRNLREKYDRLYLKMVDSRKGPKSSNGRDSPFKPIPQATGPPLMTIEEAVAAGVQF